MAHGRQTSDLFLRKKGKDMVTDLVCEVGLGSVKYPLTGY